MDTVSYILGLSKGKEESDGQVVITGGITCVDDGDGNITITEDEE